MFRDKFTRGLLAGFIGAIGMNAVNLVSFYAFNFTKQRYVDYGMIIALGQKGQLFIEQLVGLGTQLFITSVLGVAFVYLVPQVETRNFYLKATVFSLVSWFFFYGSGVVFQVPALHQHAWQTVISNVISSALFGVIMASVLRIFHRWTVN